MGLLGQLGLERLEFQFLKLLLVLKLVLGLKLLLLGQLKLLKLEQELLKLVLKLKLKQTLSHPPIEGKVTSADTKRILLQGKHSIKILPVKDAFSQLCES